MLPENYGLRLIQKYHPEAQPTETDLMGAEFQVVGFSLSYPKMTQEERNKMRESGFYRDPQCDSWVFVR